MGVGDDQAHAGEASGPQGSSFLAISALAKMGLSLRLGFVGVAGTTRGYTATPTGFFDEFDKLGVDRELVSTSPLPSGLSISVIMKGERALRVAPLANAEFVSRIRPRQRRLVSLLSEARVVHVSSFFDDESATFLADVLDAVKGRNRSTLISFDPGHEWCKSTPEGVQRLIGLSDFIMVNYDEFSMLADADVPTDLDIARTIMDRWRPGGAVVAVKQYNKVCLYSRSEDQREPVRETCFQHTPLSDREVEDATGAGDVFAAGFLAALTSTRLQVELGSLLGLTLARTKLGYVGTTGHDRFEPITKTFLQSLEKELLEENRSTRVFLSHGRDALWKEVRENLEAWGVEVESWEETARHGAVIPQVITDMVMKSGAAVVLMLGEDELVRSAGSRVGKKHRTPVLTPRQNVVHELGLLQMWLPADRVFLLTEEGVVLPSNIDGLVCIRFERGKLPRALKALRTALLQRRLLPPLAGPSQSKS